MYHRTLFFGLILFSLIFSCTPKRALKHEHTRTTNLTDTVTILTQHFEKILLRMDTDGYLQTHKANLSSTKNKFIIFTIYSNLKKAQASLVFDTLGLKIIDTQSSSGYYLSYEHLSNVFGIPLNLTLVQNIIFGFPNYHYSDSLQIQKQLTQNQTHEPNFSMLPTVNTGLTTKRRISFLSIHNNDQYSISARFNHHKNFDLHFPLTTNIKLVYNEQPMEFEIKFDKKHYVFNQPVDLEYDTLAPLKEIPFTNE